MPCSRLLVLHVSRSGAGSILIFVENTFAVKKLLLPSYYMNCKEESRTDIHFGVLAGLSDNSVIHVYKQRKRMNLKNGGPLIAYQSSISHSEESRKQKHS